MAALAGQALFAHGVGDPDDFDDDDFADPKGDFSDDDGGGEAKLGAGAPDKYMDFDKDEEGEEEELSAMAVKPFIGAIFPPSSYSGRPDNAAPAETLALEYVFGYCKKTRASVFALPDGRVFWPSASVGVLHDASRSGAEVQTHLVGHRDEITAAAQSPADGHIVATGSSQLTRRADYPATIVWDTRSGQALARLKTPKLLRQVDALCFDDTGNYVFAAGAGDRHTVVCYDLANGGAVVGDVATGSARVLAMEFDARNAQLVVAGVKSLQVVGFAGGRLARRPTRVSSATSICVATTAAGVTYVGGANGSVTVYRGGQPCGSPVKAHKGGVWALCASADGTSLATGGKDGSVTQWTLGSGGTRLRKVRKVVLDTPAAVKALAFDAAGDILVGSKAGRVAMLTASGSWHEDVLVDAHFDGETWGLAMHPFDHQAVTTGDDNTIRVWDLVTMTLLKSRELTDVKGRVKPSRASRGRNKKRGGVSTTGTFAPSNCSRAVDFDPMGEMIAVGMNDGSFMVIRESDMVTVAHKRGRGRSQWVQDLKYSPLDQVLAVSTHDNFVDLWGYDAQAKYTRCGTLEGHRSFITHLDWSADGQYLQTNCGAYELLFWDTKSVDRRKNVKRVGRPSSLADVDWQSQTCVIGWGVTGIWYSPEGYMLNACDRSHDRSLLAVGEDSSLVKLYKYPCCGTFQKSGRDPRLGGAEGNAVQAHGSHVSNVRFAFDDSLLVTVGGDDNATCVFRVVR